jgi:hypothetical protein
MVILILAVFLIFLFEGIPLIKKRMWNELTTVVLLLLIAAIMQIGKSLNMASLINIIERLFEPIGKMIFYQY